MRWGFFIGVVCWYQYTGISMFTIELDHHLDALATMVSDLRERSIKYVVANALDDATSRALEQLQNNTDQFIDKPTPWTRRSIYKSPRRVTPTKMDIISFGFKQLPEGNKGTPAGEYLRPLARGGTRPQKQFEQRTGGFFVPRDLGNVNIGGRTYKFALNQYGNLPGSKYAAVSKALMSNSESAAQFFTGRIRGVDAIFLRVGKRGARGGKPRGYVAAFNRLSSAPTYSKQFPVSDLLTRYFNDVFESSLQNAVDDELEIYMQRRLQGKN